MKNTKDKKLNVFMISAIFLLGAFVSFFNETSLTTALPTIMRDLHITASQGQWLTTIFMLVAGIMIPATPFLVKRLSTRGIFLLSIGSFAIGTALGAYSTTFGMLLTARIVQAFGAGIILPAMQTIFLTIFPKEKRGLAMGLMGIVIGVAPAIGPTLSGWILLHFSWNDLFVLVLPIVIIDLILGLIFLQNVSEAEKSKLDILSAVTSALGFGLLLLGFSNAGTDGWSSINVILPIIISIFALAIFIWRQLTLDEPFLDLSVFKNKVFTSSTIIIMILFGGFLASEVLLPIYIQEVRGYSAFDSGLTLLPGTIVMLIVSPISGMLFDKIGAKLLGILGLILMTGGTFAYSFLTANTSIILISAIYAVRLMGLALAMMPITTSGLNAIDNSLQSHGTATSSALRQISSSIVTALLVTIMSTFSKSYITNNATKVPRNTLMINAQVHGMNYAFLFASIVTFIALILTIFFIQGKTKKAKQTA